jgi:hypothetical protein
MTVRTSRKVCLSFTWRSSGLAPQPNCNAMPPSGMGLVCATETAAPAWIVRFHDWLMLADSETEMTQAI